MDKPDFPISGELLPEHMPFVYEALKKPLPPEARQHVSKEENPLNFEMTGYIRQFVDNRFNDVLGVDHWAVNTAILYDGFEDEKQQEGRMREILMKVTIVLGNWAIVEKPERGQPLLDFIPLAERTGFGGASSTSRANAYKGALTDTIKKVAAMYGVGRQAYEQTIDEAFRPESEDNGGAASQQPVESTTADHPDSPAGERQTDPKVLRDSLISTCSARKLNRHLVMVSAFGVMSSKDLDAGQLSSLIEGVQQDNFTACALAKGEDGEALKPKEQYLIALVSLISKDRQLHGLPVTASDMEETLARLATSYERIFEKLTKLQLQEIAQKVADAYRAYQLARARIRPLAAAWRDAMRADIPESSNEEAAKTFRHWCATQFKKEPIDLTDEEMAQTDEALSAGKVDVLKGEIKQVTPAETEGQEEEPMF